MGRKRSIFLPRTVYGTGFAVSYHACQHPDDVPIGDPLLNTGAVITLHHISAASFFIDAVQYILTVVAFIERHVADLQRLGNSLYHQQVARLNGGIHTVAHICIDQSALLGDDILKLFIH